MTQRNSNDRDPQPYDPAMGASGEPASDAAAAAEDARIEGDATPEPAATGSGGGGGGGGAFGPIIALIRAANEFHPIAGLLLPLLAIVVVGTVLFKVVAPYTGSLDAGRTVLLIVYLVLFAITLFAVAGDMLLQPQGKPFIPSRIVLLVSLVVIGVGSSFVVNSCSPDWLARTLAGPETCKTAPPNVADLPPPIVGGQVLRSDDEQGFMPGARVVVRHNRTFPATANEVGDYEVNLDKADIGKTVSAWATMSGFKKGETKTFQLKHGLNQLNLVLDPDSSVAAAPQFKQLAIPTLSKAVSQSGGERVAVRNVADTKTNFNGQGWRYDIFYCQPPQGDVVQSKILAVQLQKILQAQTNVGGVRVRMWPSADKPGYQIPAELQSATIIINDRVERANIADSLKILWKPYLASGESVALRPVGSRFAGYISLLACRSASAGT